MIFCKFDRLLTSFEIIENQWRKVSFKLRIVLFMMTVLKITRIEINSCTFVSTFNFSKESLTIPMETIHNSFSSGSNHRFCISFKSNYARGISIIDTTAKRGSCMRKSIISWKVVANLFRIIWYNFIQILFHGAQMAFNLIRWAIFHSKLLLNRIFLYNPWNNSFVFRLFANLWTIWINLFFIRIFINLFSQFTFPDLWENFVFRTVVFLVASSFIF